MIFSPAFALMNVGSKYLSSSSISILALDFELTSFVPLTLTFWPSFTGALAAADTGAAVNTNTSAATAATSGIVLVDLMGTSFSRRSTDRTPAGIARTPQGYCGGGNLPLP